MPSPTDDQIEYRQVATLAEYEACVALQDATWGPGFREVVPSAMLQVTQKMGGVCAGAFASDGRLLGFVFGLTGVRHGVLAHWSDMLAVRPEARGRHVGDRLKRLQRDLCVAIGVRTMYWTFDPLVARNAHFNLTRLGARASEYVVNMYGSNTGSPLHGALETDRWVAAWDLAEPMGAGATGLDDDAATCADDGVPFVVALAADGRTPVTVPSTAEAVAEAPVVRVAIPPNHEELSLAERVQWRVATRGAFLPYLSHGYEVVRFRRASGGMPPYYELAHR